MSDPTSPRVRIHRNAIRAEYDIEEIKHILDAERICHVAYVTDGEPRIIPTLYMRQGDEVFLHGNRQSAMLRHVADGGLVNIAVTLTDGIVVARSGFHCSMNYRSVSLFGTGRLLEGDEHERILDAFVEALIPGHAAAVRAPTRQELSATSAVAVPIKECVAKVRTGDPIDAESDLESDVWAGVIPLVRSPGLPRDSADLKAGVAMPDYISGYQLPDRTNG